MTYVVILYTGIMMPFLGAHHAFFNRPSCKVWPGSSHDESNKCEAVSMTVVPLQVTVSHCHGWKLHSGARRSDRHCCPSALWLFWIFIFRVLLFGQVESISSPGSNPIQQPAIKVATTLQRSGCLPSEVVTTWIFERWSWTSVSEGSAALEGSASARLRLFQLFPFPALFCERRPERGRLAQTAPLAARTTKARGGNNSSPLSPLLFFYPIIRSHFSK